MRSLEQYLSDMMRTGEQAHLDGRGKWFIPGVDEGGVPTGNYLDEVDPSGNIGANVSPRSLSSLVGVAGAGSLDGNERYSRKVFVGGLPPDIDEGACALSVSSYGALLCENHIRL